MKILAFDIESTTGSHLDGSMCTFGYCLVSDNKIIEQRDIVMKPCTKRFETKIKLQYEKSYIKSQPTFDAFYEEIKNLIENADLVCGFSVMNDVEFLNNACDLYNLQRINYKFLDVQLLHKTIYKLPNLSGLEKATLDLNIEYVKHRSDEDARATILLLLDIIEKEKLEIKEVLKKHNITLGINKNGETVNCKNGVLSHKEINYLIADFIDKNYKHSYKIKTPYSKNNYAFSETCRYSDIYLFRKVLKKLFTLNAKTSSLDTANIFVYSNQLQEKEIKYVESKTNAKSKIQIIKYEDLIKELGELPEINFDEDDDIIRKKHQENKKLKEEQRKLKKQQYYKNLQK